MRKLLCLGLSLLFISCTDDPQDPKTWIKKLNDVREQKEAVRQLSRLKDESAYEPLAALFKRSRDPEHLKAIGKLRTDKAIDLFVEQLDYSEESFENAVAAATGVADIAGRDDKGRAAAAAAVEALNKAITKKLPIKTRANLVKIEAMKALAAIKDPRAVPALNQVLEVSADDQDFLLNLDAAKHLGGFADKRSIPTLTRGLFMNGRGEDAFPSCSLALVRIGGDETVDKLVETMQRKNQQIEADAKKWDFIPGIVVQKTSIVLGHLRSKRALPALLKELEKKDDGLAPNGVSGHQSVLQALGLIGDPSVAKPLIAVVTDAKRHAKHRAAAAAGLNFLGATEALPALLALAKTPYFEPKTLTIDPDKGGLAMYGVTEYSRLADTDVTETLIPLYKAAPEATDAQIAFKNALARVAIVKECQKDAACYEKRLAASDPDKDKTVVSARSEKAAFMLGRLPDSVKHLVKHVAHRDPATRSAVLLSLTRTATKANTDVLKAIADQVDIDRTKPPFAQLVDEMRVAAAIISAR